MRDYYAGEGYPFDPTEARRALDGLLADSQRGCVFVAEEDRHVIAYVAVTLGWSLEYRGRDAFLDEVYIAPEARDQGLGGEAVDLAEAACRALGVRALHLEVEQANESAHELYRRRGFVSQDRHLLTKRLD